MKYIVNVKLFEQLELFFIGTFIYYFMDKNRINLDCKIKSLLIRLTFSEKSRKISKHLPDY